MYDPRELHLTAMKCILLYLQGTPDYGLLLRRSSSSDLVVYTDADWAGCLDTRRSTSDYAMFLGDNLVPGRPSGRPSSPAPVLRPSIVSLPTTWLRPPGCVSCSTSSRPRRLGAHLSTAIISASCTSTNPVQYQCTKHVDIDLHFIRENVAIGQVCVLHVPMTSQFADIFTKGLPSSVSNEF
jgi:hypothetical protein